MLSQFAAKVGRSLARDRALPPAERVRKAARYLLSSATAPRYLRACDSVGPRARTIGRPSVENAGRIEIGADAVLNSEFSPVELVAHAGGVVRLGASVRINYGTSIAAATSVTVGDDVSIGPYSIVDDGEAPDAEGAAPIVIGNGVWLAGRVTVLAGSRIGDGAVITAGSVVEGEIPPRVVAGGIPARVLRPIGAGAGADLGAGADMDVGESPPPSSSPAAGAAALTGGSATRPAEGSPRAEVTALTGIVLADFTIGDLAARLRDPVESPIMVVADAPFCQTTQWLLQRPPEGASDFVVVWTRPELAVPGFRRLLDGQAATEAELIADVDAFADLVARGATAYRFAFVPTWTVPTHHRGLGLIDCRPGGVRWGLSIMNHRLMQRLAEAANVYVLDAQRWLAAAGGRPAAKGWYLGKVPFLAEVFAEAARDLKSGARGLLGQARKLVVLDLDDTLWGGIVGDAGWENLQLGGHDGVGEAFVDFQRELKALTRRGVLLGVVSKNTEEVALEAMRSHPEMVLRPEDFVGWRINWRDKAQNVAELAAELNLGLQSVVFIDDNPVERARVREALPEVLVPEWPEDRLLYPSELLSLRAFDTPVVSREDAERGKLYAAERERDALLREVGSMDDWLASLGIRVHVEPLGASNLARATQLLNKTNQMNLRTRRLSESELAEWSRHPDHALWTVTVSDRFGSAGLTGLLGLAADGEVCRIEDFVLSCRVMGRRIEESMAHVAVEWARGRGLSSVVASYVPTKKNKPCHDFWKGSGFASDAGEREFSWRTAEEYALPAPVTMEWEEGANV